MGSCCAAKRADRILMDVDDQEAATLNDLNDNYSLYQNVPNTTRQLIVPDTKAVDSNDMIFCFYPVDTLLGPQSVTSIYLRSTPFDTHHLSPYIPTPRTMSAFLEHDESNQIYYLPLGTSPHSLSLRTPDWKWPDRYTMLIWIRWSGIHGLLTTFDSDSNSPIFISQCRLGCAGKSKSGNSKWDVLRYKVAEDKWQCVIAEGGGSQTVFRVGDLQTVPTLKGVVKCDVTGQITHRLGNKGQGPGDVGCVMVFDRTLSDQEIEEMYEESKFVMKGPCWSKTDARNVKSVILPFVEGIDGIAKIVMDMLLGDFAKKYTL